MSHHPLTAGDLLQFAGGTAHWYRHGLARGVLYTDGVQHVAEAGGAYWLLDEIALAQSRAEVKAEEFQCWTLTVSEDGSAVLRCTDGNDRQVIDKRIPWTDFPLSSVTLWVEQDEAHRVILLPNEH